MILAAVKTIVSHENGPSAFRERGLIADKFVAPQDEFVCGRPPECDTDRPQDSGPHACIPVSVVFYRLQVCASRIDTNHAQAVLAARGTASPISEAHRREVMSHLYTLKDTHSPVVREPFAHSARLTCGESLRPFIVVARQGLRSLKSVTILMSENVAIFRVEHLTELVAIAKTEIPSAFGVIPILRLIIERLGTDVDLDWPVDHIRNAKVLLHEPLNIVDIIVGHRGGEAGASALEIEDSVGTLDIVSRRAIWLVLFDDLYEFTNQSKRLSSAGSFQTRQITL